MVGRPFVRILGVATNLLAAWISRAPPCPAAPACPSSPACPSVSSPSLSSADHDVYEERYGQGNPDIVAVVFSPTRQALQGGDPTLPCWFRREPNARETVAIQDALVQVADQLYLDRERAAGRPRTRPGGGSYLEFDFSAAAPGPGVPGAGPAALAPAAGAAARAAPAAPLVSVAGAGAVAAPAAGPLAAAAVPAAGAPAGAAGAAPPAAAGVVGPPAELAPVWVLIGSTGGGSRGDVVQLNGTERIEGDIGLLKLNAGWAAIRRISMDPSVYRCAGSRADIRLVDVPPRPDGSRQRLAWREAVPMMVENPIPGWPLDGPRTLLWCAQFIDKRRNGPVEHYNSFFAFYHLTMEDFEVGHYAIIMKMIRHLGCWDQVNVPDLVGAELATRQAQLHEYIYSMEFVAQQSKGSKDGDEGDGKKRGRGRGGGLHRFGIVDEAAVFTGAVKEDGRSRICPLLLEQVSKQVERDAGILKQIRKAREEPTRTALGYPSPESQPGRERGRPWASRAQQIYLYMRLPTPAPTFANEMTDALNDLWGCPPVARRQAPAGMPVPAAGHALALSELRQAAVRFGPCPEGLDGPGALEELRISQSYEGDATLVAPVSFDLVDSISLPPAGSQPAALEAIDEMAGQNIARRLKELLLPQQLGMERIKEVGPRRLYTDPALRNPRLYRMVVRRLMSAGLVDFSSSAECYVGMFFVRKKNGSLRMILDGRHASLRFAPADSVELATGSAFAQISVDGDEPISIGGVDICDAFYQIELPQWLRRYFGLPKVRAGDLGLVNLSDGTPVRPSAWVVPCFRCPPMGWSISLWICQSLNEAVTARALPGHFGRRLVDRRPAPDLQQGMAHTVYVDNFIALSHRLREVRDAATAVQGELTASDLPSHPVEASVGGDTLGWHFDEDKPVIGLSVRLRWRLRLGIGELLEQGWCSGHTMMKKTITSDQARRLSIFNERWRFSRDGEQQVAPRDKALASESKQAQRITSSCFKQASSEPYRDPAVVAAAMEQQVPFRVEPKPEQGEEITFEEVPEEAVRIKTSKLDASCPPAQALGLGEDDGGKAGVGPRRQGGPCRAGDAGSQEADCGCKCCGRSPAAGQGLTLLEEFLDGGKSSAVRMLMAAFAFVRPTLGRRQWRQLWAARAAKTWSCLAPPRPRLTLSRLVVCLLVVTLCCGGLEEYAWPTAPTVDLYPRPREALDFVPSQLIPPRLTAAEALRQWCMVLQPSDMQTPSMIDVLDETLRAGLTRSPRVPRPEQEPHHRTPGGHRLLPVAQAQWSGHVMTVLAGLGLQVWSYLMHGHNGGCHELFAAARPLRDIHMLSRWSTDAALQCYAEGRQVQEHLRGLPRALPLSAEQALRGSGVFLEVFSGSGRMAAAWRLRFHSQHAAFELDIRHDADSDLLLRRIRQQVRGWVRSRLIVAIWIATPCQSMSRARNRPNGPPPLRTALFPLGLPGLSPGDQLKETAALDRGTLDQTVLMRALEHWLLLVHKCSRHRHPQVDDGVMFGSCGHQDLSDPYQQQAEKRNKHLSEQVQILKNGLFEDVQVRALEMRSLHKEQQKRLEGKNSCCAGLWGGANGRKFMAAGPPSSSVGTAARACDVARSSTRHAATRGGVDGLNFGRRDIAAGRGFATAPTRAFSASASGGLRLPRNAGGLAGALGLSAERLGRAMAGLRALFDNADAGEFGHELPDLLCPVCGLGGDAISLCVCRCSRGSIRELRERLLRGYEFQPGERRTLSGADKVLRALGLFEHPGDFFPPPSIAKPSCQHRSDPERKDYWVLGNTFMARTNRGDEGLGDKSSLAKSPLEPPRYLKWLALLRARCRVLCNDWRFSVLTTTLTLYGLFGDDTRRAFTSKHSDTVFDVLTTLALTVFTVEIVASSLGQDGYFLGFFFWMGAGQREVTSACTWRLREARHGDAGARATRGRRPLRILVARPCDVRAACLLFAEQPQRPSQKSLPALLRTFEAEVEELLARQHHELRGRLRALVASAAGDQASE
ncbi:unnamed protein product, partial [Prorocentrum cordatum]